MRGGLRLAGSLEFASVDAPPNYRRADMLLAMAKRMLPGLDGAVNTRWMGHQPATPDSLPVLGRAGRFANVIFAFGRGQLGLTMAAVTGEVVADLAAARARSGLDTVLGGSVLDRIFVSMASRRTLPTLAIPVRRMVV